MDWIYLFLALFLTLGLEGIIFFLFQYRERLFWEIFLYTNIASNILLNLIVYLLRVTLTKVPDYCYIFPLEIAVIFGEWKIYHLFFPNKKRLFLITALANVFSFAIGLLIFGL
jgi:hypothetical protein